ncbi:hypothetical protein SteCoe_32186 [Stentor coeruleus]|uniref:GAR domain-containing protein n=1 Tax=Stentor coeruleus TaxID=5963 RepID=A0A1R2AZL7_9CILI|nr:hypothetical protein SteCoe_32186 [Stentor coeruleus]
MKNRLSLSILKVEGIGDQSGCYIIIDDSLLDVISVQETEIHENCTEVPLKGVLKLIVKSLSKNSQIQCSVSIILEALPSEGVVWLPLYTSSNCETLPQIPSILPSTKILISLNQLSLLTPVPEITEYDSSMFDIENSLCKIYNSKGNFEGHDKCKKTLGIINEKNKDLRFRVLELDNKLQDLNIEHCKDKNNLIQTNHECFSKLAIQLEKYKMHCGNLQIVHEDHIKQIEGLQTLFKQEILQREHIEKQLIRITQEFQDYANITNEKIQNYEKTIEVKNQEIISLKNFQNISISLGDHIDKDIQVINLQTQLHNCLEQLQESEFNRKLLQQKLEKVAEFYSKELDNLLKSPNEQHEHKIFELTQEIKKYKQKCTDLENMIDDEYIKDKIKDHGEYNNKPIEDMNIRNSELLGEIAKLKEKLEKEKKVNECLLNQVREKNCKEIDNKVKGADEKFLEYLKNYGIEEKFDRVMDGIFVYGNKKVSVTIKNGCLICKVGGGYMGIEKFLKSYFNEKDENGVIIHKRSQTAVLKEKGTREESTIKLYNQKDSMAKITLISKENTDDIMRIPKTVTNKLSSNKFKSFTSCKETIFKKTYK